MKATTPTEANRDRIDVFLSELKNALGTSESQRNDILAEVRSDLGAHRERHLAAGLSEDESVERAIAEMGDPFELARRMRREVPPFAGRPLSVIRYGAAGALIVWTAVVLWIVRGGVYGFSATLFGVVACLHFPGILLLWPRIVWRKNWLFGLIPAGLVAGVAMIAAVTGVESGTEMPLAVGEEASGVPLNDPYDSAAPFSGMVAAGALTLFSVVLLLAVQRRAQRRFAALALVAGVGIVEAAYQAEEAVFRRDRDHIRSYLAESLRVTGAHPTPERFRADGPKPGAERASLRGDGDAYTAFWIRPLNPGHSLVFSSADDRVRVQD